MAMEKMACSVETSVTTSETVDGFALSDEDIGELQQLNRQLQLAEAQERGTQEILTRIEALSQHAQEHALTISLASEAHQSVVTNLQAMKEIVEQLARTDSSLDPHLHKIATIASQATACVDAAVEALQQIEVVGSHQAAAVKMVSDFAQHTNLLALNVTIAAVRSGDSGNGISTIAQEIRDLSRQAAHASELMNHHMAIMQQSLNTAVTAVSSTRETLDLLAADSPSQSEPLCGQISNSTELLSLLGNSEATAAEVSALLNPENDASQSQNLADRLQREIFDLKQAAESFLKQITELP